MVEENDERQPITAPENRKGRALARSTIEGVAELVPGVSLFTALYRNTHPPKAEVERDTWQEAITDRSNEHDVRLDYHQSMLAPTETITGLQAQLLAAMVQDCPDGLAHKHYETEELCTLLPDAEPQAVEDAAFDLEALGLLKARKWINGWSMALNPGTYAQIDAQVMGWDTYKDAVTVAELMLAEDTGHAPNLHAKTGWEKRRFNPAFAMLLPLFPPGRVRQVIQADYPSLGVVLAAEDRAALRRYVRGSQAG